MDNYKRMYFLLFNAVTDAVDAIEQQNFGQAKELLVQAQLCCEEFYMSQGEET